MKNCATCKYSEREITSLLLYCKGLPNHPMKIENSWQTAKECNSYTPAWEKEAERKNKQLKLKL